MTKTQMSAYKAQLLKKRSELEQQQQANLESIAVEQTADTLDEVQNATERDLAVRLVDRKSTLLRGVVSALRRIDEGTFGICVHCEEDISVRRLDAVPWTPFCISCQERADARIQNSDEIAELLS